MTKVFLPFLVFFCFLIPSLAWSQVAGDLRSVITGDWNTATTWERYSSGGVWQAAGVGENNPSNVPSASVSVFIQAGHTVSLNTVADCNNLNLNTTSNETRLALGQYTLNVNGKLRAFTATAPGTSTGTISTNSAWITTTTGKLGIVGNTRTITTSGEWGAGSSASGYQFPIEINLNSGQTVTVGTGIKANSWNVVSGTLDAGSNTISIDNGTTGQGDVTINTGATIISNASSASTAVFQRSGSTRAGTLTVNGTLKLTGASPNIAMNAVIFNGTVEYSRGGAQTFAAALSSGASPGTYTNLILSGSGAKTIPVATPVAISGTLSITGAASLAVATNAKLTLNSTARLAPVTSSALSALTGDVTVERPITSAANRAYRLLASTVSTSTSIKTNWQEAATTNTSDPAPGYGTHITGSTTDQTGGFDGTPTGQASLFTYDQVSATQAWTPISNTTPNTLNAKTGYLIYIRGDRTSSNLTSTTSSNTTLRTTGVLLTGNQDYSSLESNGRFSLVTNPYASPISWSAIYSDGTTSANFENYYTYWDPNISTRGAYVTVTSAGTNNAGTNATVEIQQGQAFFVKTKAGVSTPTLTIKESHKSSTIIDVFRVGSPEMFRMRLFYNDNGTRRLADGAVELFNNDFSSAVDGNDAEKFANFDENIAIVREGKMLSIEGRPLIDGSDNIPLSIARLKQQQYEWQFDPSNFAHPNLQAFLQDKFTNSQMPISLTAATIVAFNVTADPASAAADRFTIVFTPSVALPISMTSVKAYQKSAGIQIEWNVLNELNIDKYEIEKSVNGTTFLPATTIAANGNSSSSKTYVWYDGNPNAGNNFYRIRSINKNGVVVYSDIVRISLGKGAMLLSLYPNPVKDEVIGLQLTNLEKGKYTINLTNQLGQRIYTKVIEHSGGSISQTLQPGNAFVSGIYQLQFKGEKANITQQVIKQ